MFKLLIRELRPALMMMVQLTLVTGLVYPLLVTLGSGVVFHDRAEGSLVRREGHVVGSRLIGQGFQSAKYFWPRPSGAGYNGAASSGTNLAPSNPALVEAVKGHLRDYRTTDSLNTALVPEEMALASGSGLDPHVSMEAAMWQASRVARERGMSVEKVEALVRRHAEGRTFGVLGEERVNVLLLNLALDASP